MIRSLIRLLFKLPGRVASAALGVWKRCARGGRAVVPGRITHLAHKLLVRTRAWWRICAKVLLVIAGLGLFVGLEYLTAKTINQGEWMYLIALYMVIICLATVIARPEWAFTAWLAVSPVAGIYLQMRKFENLPQVTFDRLVIYSLAGVLLARTLVRKEKIKKLILPEVLYLAFAGYGTREPPVFSA